MDRDTWLAYYLYVNHGVLPGAVAHMGERERTLAYVMAQKEIESRQKSAK